MKRIINKQSMFFAIFTKKCRQSLFIDSTERVAHKYMHIITATMISDMQFPVICCIRMWSALAGQRQSLGCLQLLNEIVYPVLNEIGHCQYISGNMQPCRMNKDEFIEACSSIALTAGHWLEHAKLGLVCTTSVKSSLLGTAPLKMQNCTTNANIGSLLPSVQYYQFRLDT